MRRIKYDFLDKKGPKVEFLDEIKNEALEEQCRMQYHLRMAHNAELDRLEGPEGEKLSKTWESINTLRKQINDGFTKDREKQSGSLIEQFYQAVDQLKTALLEMTTDEMLTSENRLLRFIGSRIQQEGAKQCREQRNTTSPSSST